MDKPTQDELQHLLEEATFDYTLGDADNALEKLNRVLEHNAEYFEAWHALAEVYYSKKQLDESLKAAEQAHAIKPDDLHLNTSLSRIWVALGDKDKAEHFGAQARLLGWKDQLKEPPQESF